MDPLPLVTLALGALNLLLLAVLLLRWPPPPDLAPLASRIDALERSLERAERLAREQAVQGREADAQEGRALRGEVAAQLQRAGDSTLQQLGELGRTQQTQFEALLEGLGRMAEASHGHARLNREETTKRLDALTAAVDGRLGTIRAENATQLERMRATVDEKLQGALEQRLGESFRLVSERLELVHRGLGEMQALASGVGDLKRVLTNVKVRGTWGEVQLAGLLEQLLTREQYDVNVATRAGSAERVEFAIRLPGRGEGADEVVWLPIDAKFPQEDYQQLVEAQERGDAAAVEAAAKRLEVRIRGCARDICEKYLNPPATTDFAIMFLPTEGLYAEVIRRAGLVDQIQRECRVVVAGPTTLAALLNSLQMGFRTLAIQQRSSEVWSVLGAVKTEFGRFGGVLEKVKKKLQEASNVVDSVQVRTRAMDRQLRAVEALPAPDAEVLLLEGAAAADGGAGAAGGADDEVPAVVLEV
jgi:DNA recombination protein RmuC